MGQSERIEAARLALMETALDGQWAEALNAVARACGGHCGQLITLDGGGRVAGHWLTGLPEDFGERIEAYGLTDAGVNPRLRIGRYARVLSVVADQEHVDAEMRRRHPIYAEMFEPHEVGFNCQTVLDRSQLGLVRLSVSRNTPLDADDIEAFHALAPYVRSAVRMRQTLEAAGLDASLRTLSALSEAAFIMDRTGHVIGMTDRASDIATEARALTLREGRLVARRAVDQAPLENAVARACTGLPGLRLVIGGEGAEVATLDIQPLGGAGGPVVGAAALVVVRRPARMAEQRDAIERRWGLTPAESDIVMGLCHGRSLGEIAAVRGVSGETVRSQLRAVFSKMGVNRQAEVVAHVARPAEETA